MGDRIAVRNFSDIAVEACIAFAIASGGCGVVFSLWVTRWNVVNRDDAMHLFRLYSVARGT